MIMPLGQNLPSVTVRKRKFKILNELLVLQGKKKRQNKTTNVAYSHSEAII